MPTGIGRLLIEEKPAKPARGKLEITMQVANVRVNDEMLVVRVGEEDKAIYMLSGDDVTSAEIRIEHAEMTEAEFVRIPEYQ